MEELGANIFKLLANNTAEIVGVCILMAFIAVLTKIKNDLLGKFVKLTQEFPRILNSHEGTVKMSIECDRKINMELSRLMFSAKSSRVSLLLFHNGSVFSTNSPIWKISATHECCEVGTSQEVQKVQDLKASLLTPLISPMFTGNSADGIESLLPTRCAITNEICSRKYSICRVDPESVHNCFTKTFLMNRGTKFGIVTPLMDWDESIVGFIFIEYCQEGFLSEDELDATTHSACKTSSIIYELISNLDTTTILSDVRKF